jgi:hypothetical protein
MPSLVLLQGSSELATFMAGIGYDRPDSRKQRTHRPHDLGTRNVRREGSRRLSERGEIRNWTVNGGQVGH